MCDCTSVLNKMTKYEYVPIYMCNVSMYLFLSKSFLTNLIIVLHILAQHYSTLNIKETWCSNLIIRKLQSSYPKLQNSVNCFKRTSYCENDYQVGAEYHKYIIYIINNSRLTDSSYFLYCASLWALYCSISCWASSFACFSLLALPEK